MWGESLNPPPPPVSNTLAARTVERFLCCVERKCFCTDRRGAYRVLVGKPEGKRPLGRPGSRWEDNIKMDF
jgi:hypothetical protein